MNPIQQFNELNQQFSLDFTEGTRQGSIGLEFTNNSIYKAKANFVDGSVSNSITNTFNGQSSAVNSTYNTVQYGHTRIFCNKAQITGLSIDLGISASTNDPSNARNIIIDSKFLKQFPRLKKFYFRHYAYNNSYTYLKGKVTGDWSDNFSPEMEYFEMSSVDYPNSTASFNLNNIPGNSKLQYLALGGYAPAAANSNVTVSGDLNHIPTSCTTVILGSDRSGTTNSVSGMIPNWVTYFSRIGRNTITADVNQLNDNLQYLSVSGNNSLSGNLKSFPLCTVFSVQGNNTISGTIQIMPVCTYFSVMGSNCKISGLLNNDINLPNAETINVTGINMLSGVIKTSSKITTLNIAGNNQIEGLELLSNCISFTLQGNNTISGNPFQYLPKARTIVIQGNNRINTYTSRTYPTMSRFILQGLAELDQAKVDMLLKDLSEAEWASSGAICIIQGNCQPPSNVGKTYATVIANKGVSVTTH